MQIKSIRAEDMTRNTENEVLKELRMLRRRVAALERRTAAKSNFVNASGVEVIAGIGDPRDTSGDDPFTGTAMLYPAFVDANGDEWHFIGKNNGILQFGLSAEDGKVYFGAGAMMLDENGYSYEIDSYNSRNPEHQIKSYDGATLRTFFTSDQVAGGFIRAMLGAIQGSVGGMSAKALSTLISYDSSLNEESSVYASYAPEGIGDPVEPGRAGETGLWRFNRGATKTIAAGVVTAPASYFLLETQGGAASDDLDTVNGLGDGDVVFMSTVSGARDVVVKHNTGNIAIHGGADFTLDTARDVFVGIYNSNVSRLIGFGINGA